MGGVFRDKSVSRVSTPEQLNQCVAISGVWGWGILIAALIFLMGLVLWAFTGYVETIVEVGATVSGGRLTALVREDQLSDLKPGDELEIDGETFTLDYVAAKPRPLSDEETGSFVAYVGELESGDWVYDLGANCDLADGNYRGQVVTESVWILTFVLNER